MGTLSPFPRKTPLTVYSRLNRLMADEHVFYINNRHARLLLCIHQDGRLRMALERHDEILITLIDWLLQRTRFLDDEADVSPFTTAQKPRLTERVETSSDSRQIGINLLHDHEFMIERLIRDHAECERGFRDAASAGLVLKVLDLHKDMASDLRLRLS